MSYSHVRFPVVIPHLLMVMVIMMMMMMMVVVIMMMMTMMMSAPLCDTLRTRVRTKSIVNE